MSEEMPVVKNWYNTNLIIIASRILLHLCFQLNHALQRQKVLFDNVNFDWNLSHDEGSTDFSDDETIIEDRVRRFKIYCRSPVTD